MKYKVMFVDQNNTLGATNEKESHLPSGIHSPDAEGEA